MTGAPSIHRLLDEAFVDVTMTPDLQDLKEELRGNLSARVDELLAAGADPSTASTTAMAELGDLRELIAETEREGHDRPATASGMAGAFAEHRLRQVRPRPAFVLRTVALSIVLAAAVVLVALGASGVLAWSLGLLVALGVVAGAAGDVVTGDALRQETTTHYPLPPERSTLYGVAAGCGITALALGGLGTAVLVGSVPVGSVPPAPTASTWLIIVAAVLAAACLAGLIALGVTQTNRTKEWVLEAGREMEQFDRFSRDPMAAARFGIYTLTIWILAIAAFIVLSLTVGFLWSWLALVAGAIVFFLVLARMLFTDGGTGSTEDRGREDGSA